MSLEDQSTGVSDPSAPSPGAMMPADQNDRARIAQSMISKFAAHRLATPEEGASAGSKFSKYRLASEQSPPDTSSHEAAMRNDPEYRKWNEWLAGPENAVIPALRPDAGEAARTMVDSSTFGVSSKAIAAAKALTGNAPSYSAALSDERSRLAKFEQESPGRAFESKLVGGALTGAGLGRAGITLVGNLPKAMPLATKIARYVAEGMGYGGAEAAGHSDVEANQDWNAFVKNTALGSALGGAVGAGSALLGHAAGKVGQIFQPVKNATTEAIDRLNARGGTQVQIPNAIASENPVVNQAGSVAASTPGVGKPVVKASEKFIQDLDTKASELASSAGGRSPQAAGTAVGGDIKDWITGESDDIASAAYDKAEKLVNPNSRHLLPETQGRIANIAADHQAGNIVGGSKAVDQVLPAATNAKGLTVDGIKKLRTSIGEQISKGILPEGTSMKEMKHIYEGLSRDYENAIAASGGPKAAAAYARANSIAKGIAGRREALAKIVGAEGDKSGEKVIANIAAMASNKSTADVALLAKARQVVGPKAWEQLAGTLINHMGRDADGNFSAIRFLGPNGFNKLSPSAKAILFKGNPGGDLLGPLEDLATASKAFKNAQKYANTSKTSQYTAVATMAAGLVRDPVTTLGLIFGGRQIAKALANPATASAAARWSGAYTRLATRPSPGTLAALVSSTKNMAATAAQHIGSTLSPQNIIEQLTGGRVPAAATEEPSAPSPAPGDDQGGE